MFVISEAIIPQFLAWINKHMPFVIPLWSLYTCCSFEPWIHQLSQRQNRQKGHCENGTKRGSHLANWTLFSVIEKGTCNDYYCHFFHWHLGSEIGANSSCLRKQWTRRWHMYWSLTPRWVQFESLSSSESISKNRFDWIIFHQSRVLQIAFQVFITTTFI